MVRYDFENISLMQTKARGVKAMNLSDDQMAFGLALHADGNAVLLKTESGMMKRLRLSELKLFNRPAKGELVAKRVKSNPQTIESGVILGSFDEIKITHQKTNWRLAKEVPLMDKESTFSQSGLSSFYLMKGIEEVLIKDFVPVNEKMEPEPHEGEHKDVEFIHFEL